ncbi:MAG: Glu/Leu/Phe/Val dehydrogenase [Patescibacteria group bacterium]
MNDKIGPRNIIKTYHPGFDVWGFLVIDNTMLGPGKGGIRMTPTVSEEEVAKLARAMTLKNALAGIAFGGAKAGLALDPRARPATEVKKIIEWFARELKPLIPNRYIAGPDINTTEREMAWFVGAIKDRRGATGKPKRLGGLPHELGSTGYGVALATLEALRFKKIETRNATVAVEGFGNVGQFAAKFLSEQGTKIVAVSDSKGAIYNPAGLDLKKLMASKKQSGSVINYPDGEKLPGAKIFELETDVLIPAALPDVITNANAEHVRAKIIVEGANIPIAPAVEATLHQNGILIVPDIVANAGGVISSYAEYRGWNEKKMFQLVKQKITVSTSLLLKKLKTSPTKSPRDLATTLALARLKK